MEASEATVGLWVVERNVSFYLKGQLIGVVTLRGEKYDRDPSYVKSAVEAELDVDDVLSAWAVSHVWYYRIVGGRKPEDLKERIETDVPYLGLSSGQI